MIKKFFSYLCLLCISILSCSKENPTQPTSTPVLEKMVAVGNSLTAGVQSAGLVQEFQLHSYPYLIAGQIGKAADFQQPLIGPPGVGEIDLNSGKAYGPLKYENGLIVQGDSVPGGINGIPNLLLNAYLPRPYDNLGLPGADVNDLLTATGGGVYDLVLRNPYFGNTTALQQAKSLNPTLILLWAGNNDVLGAALDGGDPSLITPISDFQNRFHQIVTELLSAETGDVAMVMANIPDVADIPYVNFLDEFIYKEFYDSNFGTVRLPVLFDLNFRPIDFDTSSAELYIPLLCEEDLSSSQSLVKHLLLPFLEEYWFNGVGVPDSATVVNYLVENGWSLPDAARQVNYVQQILSGIGLTPSNVRISGNLTITESEEMVIKTAVSEYNNIIAQVASAQNPPIPIVDANSLQSQLNISGLDGYSGKFVLIDPLNTAFSLDGVHPNNGGYALIANAFIDVINQNWDVQIPYLNTQDYKGQYAHMQPKLVYKKAAEQVKTFFKKEDRRDQKENIFLK